MALLAVGCSLLGGCGATARPAASSKATADPPSASARMICAPEAQLDIANALGSRTTRPVKPTWTDHLYSCQYAYRGGQVVLSVKELRDDTATVGYVDSLVQRLGKRSTIGGLGQAAFDTANDSIVVRKDFKVLDVDVSGLPARFGNPAVDRSTTAMRIAVLVMGCWTGH
jgi:hypothetical protein